MTITRWYGAEDNNVNKEELKVILGWAKKNNEVISECEIWKLCVSAKTESGRNVIVLITDSTGGSLKMISKYLIMYEEINGKRVRIKKAQW